MGRKVVTDQQAGFAGGLNVTSDPAFLRPDQARRMDNMRLSNYGAALKRLGSMLTTSTAVTTFNSTLGPFGGIWWPAQDKAYIVAPGTATTALHAYRASYQFPTTWSDLGAITQFRPVLFTDGTNEALYLAGYNASFVDKIVGTTISTLGSATAKVAGLCVYNDRLWGWSDNTLYYSNLSSAVGSTGGDSLGNTTAGGGSIIVRTFGAATINACAAVNGSLLIFHETGISVLTGWGQDDTTVQPQALNASVGMGEYGNDYAFLGLAVGNLQGAGDVAYFMTNFGIFATNGGYVRALGTPDKPDPIAQLMRDGRSDPALWQLIFNRRYNELWCASALGVYVYNITLEAWSGPFSLPSTAVRSFFEVLDPNANPWMWLISKVSGQSVYVTEYDSFGGLVRNAPVILDFLLPDGTGGSPVTSTLQMHRFFCGDRSNAKSIRWVNVLATLNVSATNLSGIAPTMAYTNSVNGSGTLTFRNLASIEKQYYLSPGGSGVWLDATITDANTATTSQYALATVEGYFLGQR